MQKCKNLINFAPIWTGASRIESVCTISIWKWILNETETWHNDQFWCRFSFQFSAKTEKDESSCTFWAPNVSLIIILGSIAPLCPPLLWSLSSRTCFAKQCREEAPDRPQKSDYELFSCKNLVYAHRAGITAASDIRLVLFWFPYMSFT